jgi:peptidoglycan/xylan/chitin deacetylase (PgdA/CDA1 family)
VELLAARGVRATFFLQGRWVQAHPTLAARIAADGHLIGNHGFYHAPMSMLSAAGLRSDVGDAEEAIVAATGVDPRPWFRCPFGTGAQDRRVAQRLLALGYRHVGWDVDPRDWSPDTTTSDFVAGVVDGVGAHGSHTIVLAHPWTVPACEGLPAALDGLAALGTTLVRVDELP